MKELIQEEMNVGNVKTELEKILKNQDVISKMKEDYADLKNLLSEGGHASKKAAKIIVDFVRKN